MSRWIPRVLEAVGWAALMPLLGLCVTQWFGIDSKRSITALQALSPYVLAAAIPLAVGACTGRRHLLALVALVPVVTLLVLTYPVVFHADSPRVAASSPRLTVAYANLLASNLTPDDALEELLAADADVMVIVELTPQLSRTLQRLADDDYPFRAELLADDPSGIGVWSRLPITAGGPLVVNDRPTVDIVLDVLGSEVRLLAVHPNAPTSSPRFWSQTLDAIGDFAAGSPHPTLIVGDFNGSRWHPSFRRLLDRGWRDAHETLGHGWSVSWPMDEGWLPPPFVRIDHALFGEGLSPTHVHDITIPGSDHKGFVAEFGLTR